MELASTDDYGCVGLITCVCHEDDLEDATDKLHAKIRIQLIDDLHNITIIKYRKPINEHCLHETKSINGNCT